LALTGSSGSTLAQYSYEPFGNTTVTSGSSTNSYEYTGRENDGTGLYFNRARYYDPTLQRFISEDPDGMAGGDLNLYAYVKNSPLDFLDPLGLITCPTASCSVTPGNGFGAPRPPGPPHNGADMPNPVGDPIVAPEGGTVKIVPNSGAGGNEVFVTTPNGNVWGNAHTGAAPGLENGQWVDEGQVIGHTDTSGDSRGGHDHVTFRPCPTCDRTDPTVLLIWPDGTPVIWPPPIPRTPPSTAGRK
jgi:RHS repeat-associated protein